MLRKEQNDLVTRTVRGLNGSPVPMPLDPGLLAGELSENVAGEGAFGANDELSRGL